MNDAPIVHHPFNVPIEIGPMKWEFTGFGLAVFMSFLIAQVVSERELRRRGHEREAQAVGDLLLAAIGGTLVGAKVYYVAFFSQDWGDLFTRGGFVYWGGFIGAVLACFIVARAKRLPFARYADVAGIAIAAGYTVGRTGCWAVGDDYGRPWDGFLAVAFPEGAPPSTIGNLMASFKYVPPPGSDPATVLSVIPTQLIETALGFVMFAVVWRLRNHAHAEGWLFGVYCLLAGAERFLVEFLRIKDDRFFDIPLSLAQLIAIGVAVVGVSIMVWRSDPDPRSASRGDPLPSAAG